jgi:hypothetical protein
MENLMPKPSIHAAARAIEAEFAEPLRDVLAGFFIQRHTIASVAQVLEVSPSSLAAYCRAQHLQPYSETLARRRGPYTHPNVTSLAMRRAARRKIQWQGRSLSAAGWEAVTGIPRDRIRKRIDVLGWPAERALTVQDSAVPIANRLRRKQRSLRHV